jgi:hypothetical protein
MKPLIGFSFCAISELLFSFEIIFIGGLLDNDEDELGDDASVESGLVFVKILVG